MDKALDKQLGLQRGPMGVAPEKWSVKKNIQQKIATVHIVTLFFILWPFPVHPDSFF